MDETDTNELPKISYREPDWDVLAESEHYYLKKCYEDASLFSKEDGRLITSVGDFYGDPDGGIIDRNERFCVTYGCGYIIYFIREPFEGYMYENMLTPKIPPNVDPLMEGIFIAHNKYLETHKIIPQWIEYGRDDPHNIEWIESVRQISDDEVEITNCNDETYIVKIPL